MDSSEDSPFHINISDLEDGERKEKERKARNNYQKKYYHRPIVKERRNQQNIEERTLKAIKELGEIDPHTICKKLGKSLVYARVDPSYLLKCNPCGVSFSENDREQFYKKNKCPCCHRILRIRKSTYQKRQMNQQK